MNKINELKNKERNLKNQLVSLVTLNDLNEELIKTINQLKLELKNISKEIKDIEYSENNWECSHSYKSINGKVDEIFKINNKIVTKEEYINFMNKNNNNNSLNKILNEEIFKSFFSPLFLI